MAAKSFRYQRPRPRVSSVHAAGLILSEPRSALSGQVAHVTPSESLYLPSGARDIWPHNRTAPAFIAADLTNPYTGSALPPSSRVRDQLLRAKEDYPATPLLIVTDRSAELEAYEFYPDYVTFDSDISEIMDAGQTIRRRREDFSAQEEQTLTLYADGKNRIDIANEMYLSIDSIKRYTLNLFRRLSVGAQVSAVHTAFSQGILASPDHEVDGAAEWPLSEAETAIVYTLGALGNHSEAADALGISDHTVKSHLKTIRKREDWRPTYAVQRMWVTGMAPEARGIAAERCNSVGRYNLN